MATVSALSTELCYNRSVLHNNHKSSLRLQDPGDSSIKESAISTTLPPCLKLGHMHQQFSPTVRGAIVTREKGDDHSLFDAAEAEAIALVRRHQATYMANERDVEKDKYVSIISNTDSSPVYVRERKSRTAQSSEMDRGDKANKDIRNIKQSRYRTGSTQPELDHTSYPDSEISDVNHQITQAKKAIPIATRGTISRQNPFQRARLHKPTQSPTTGNTTAPTLYGRDSNKLPSLVRESRYISNSSNPSPKNTEMKSAEESSQLYRDGVEIRSDEIRTATSMKQGDRSPRLPSPSLVSSSPKRPIVSFTTGTTANDSKSLEKYQNIRCASHVRHAVNQPYLTEVSKGASYNEDNRGSELNQRSSMDDKIVQPCHNADANAIPTLRFSNNDDTSAIEQDQHKKEEQLEFPSIVINGSPPHAHAESLGKQKHNRNTQDANHASHNLVPHSDRRTSDVKSPSCSFSRFGALCNSCAMPISGRIVSAAGHRFHPECFRCYHCGEGLECVAFYPEPEKKREERLLRCFEALNCRETVNGETGMDSDQDSSMRFYCHLDYHEFFSPRCKSCKTPIEGEVVVACGAHWHVGHFFCAECGDPFESSTPFVERDGYAWCIRCHTNRQSAKCKRCKRPVTNLVVSALGAEWHNDCFSCSECGSQFENGVYFLRESTGDPVCLKCEEIRLKA